MLPLIASVGQADGLVQITEQLSSRGCGRSPLQPACRRQLHLQVKQCFLLPAIIDPRNETFLVRRNTMGLLAEDSTEACSRAHVPTHDRFQICGIHCNETSVPLETHTKNHQQR